MSLTRLDADAGSDETGSIIGQVGAHPETVVVVSRSPVVLIVLSRIVERARMRAVSCEPERAQREIAERDPLVVILDGGADLHECDAAFAPIAARKRMSGGARPYVVMLTTRNLAHDEMEDTGLVDTLVAKPITPERLQPLMEQLRDRNA